MARKSLGVMSTGTENAASLNGVTNKTCLASDKNEVYLFQSAIFNGCGKKWAPYKSTWVPVYCVILASLMVLVCAVFLALSMNSTNTLVMTYDL